MMEMKKVYADVMLRSAQEAAARIVMSERRAFRFQKEAEFAKKEALGMILRLKQTMDSKLQEAEILSVREKKRIKVLERQLQEAKSIVRELREELANVCNELERIKKGEESKSLNIIRTNNDAHGSEHDEASHRTKPDASANILESHSNLKFGPESTLDVKSSALTVGKYETESQSLKSRDIALMTPRDIRYLPSILKKTRVPSLHRFSRGIHAIIGNKSDGSFGSPKSIAGSEKNKTADSVMTDSSFEKKYTGSGGTNIQIELTTCKTGSNHNDRETPIHEERSRCVEYANAPLYEYLPTRDPIRHEPTDQCPSKTAVNGSSPSEGYLKSSKKEAQKALETSRLTKTCNLKTLPEYVQEKENNHILIKPCRSKNTAGNDKKETNVPTKGVEVVQSLSTKVSASDLAFDIVPCNSDAGTDNVKYTKGSFQFTTNNIIQYSRKRSRQAKDNTKSNREAEASPEFVCLKRKASERRFDLLPDISNQVSGIQSSQNQDSQSIAQIAHQILALSDSKWSR